MTRVTFRKALLLLALGITVCCALLVAVLYAALHSPALLNRLANAFGYEIAARRISLSPLFSGSVSDLEIKSLGDDRLMLAAATVTATTSLDRVLRGEVDSLVLQNPKLTYRIDTGGAGSSGLSFLAKVPSIRMLDIRNAEALITFAGDPSQVKLTGANVRIRGFSPKSGGALAFDANFAVATAGAAAVKATGRITGNFQLAGVYPRPHGKGTLELAVASGTYTGDNGSVSLGGLTLATDLEYDRPAERLAITRLQGQSRELGAIRGKAQATLRGETPWDAALSLATIDFAQAFGLVKPFLPEEYQGWTMQGKGAVQTEVHGTYVDDRPSFTGQVTFSFNEGGFSSPDSTKAAQGVTGRIILKLEYAAPDQKLTFNLNSEGRDGEYLWGKYYTNLAGRQASLVADGAWLFGRDRHAELRGWLDLFQTGDYAFSARGNTKAWDVRLSVANVSHARILETLLKEYLTELSPGLASLSLTGTSSLEAVVRHDGTDTTIAGTFRMTGTTLNAPAMPLAIRDVAVDLPFELAYPADKGPARAVTAGRLRFDSIQRKQLHIESLQIPLVIARNALEIPEPVAVPFFGGAIRLYGVQVDDVLAPTRYQFGVKIEGVDLGRMTRELTGTEYPGVIDADLGYMTYQDHRIASQGRAVIRVFGGEIVATNFFAEHLASPSRRFGGDISFRGINLEDVTKRVAIGKVTGIIRGSLEHFVMEYGQPASFALEVESVPARGVPQRISMDAIQSISILGTGADSALNRGITRFFREYPYSKIGFRCVLNNDQFSVRGTIHEDGKEYLVRRGFLRGVDVVNQNPDNVISFRDMEERLQRISRPPQAEPAGIQVN